MNELKLTPEQEAQIAMHGEDWLAEMDEESARCKALGIPNHVPRYENKTLAIDQAAFAACPTETEDLWVALRSLVLAARIASQAVPSYRDELGTILHVLFAPIHGTRRIRHGHSLAQLRQHLSVEDTVALVYEIWKQNPESVRKVPSKTVWNDQKKPQGETDREVQVFLFDKPLEPHSEIGIAFTNEHGWRIDFVKRNAYQLLAGWRKTPQS